jgi:hypothetical protein
LEKSGEVQQKPMLCRMAFMVTEHETRWFPLIVLDCFGSERNRTDENPTELVAT